MNKYFTAAVFALLTLTGCNKKPALSCDGEFVVQRVVSQQYESFNQLAKQPVMQGLLNGLLAKLGTDAYAYALDTDFKNIAFRLGEIEAVALDRELDIYQCQGVLYSEKDGRESDGIKISYSAEAINGGKGAYIASTQLSDGQLSTLAAVMLKGRVLIEKTVSGKISYGSQDSEIGGFTFTTDSGAGNTIFEKCGARSECEVSAFVEETEFGDLVRTVVDVKPLANRNS